MTNLLTAVTNSVKHWYIPLLAGILFIVLGIYIFTVPLAAYLSLSYLFSISFIVSGIFDISFSIANRESLNGWGWYLSGGLLNLLLGVYLIMYPAVSIEILPFYVGFTMLFKSFQGLGFAFDLKSSGILSWGNLALISVLGIILAFILLAHPIFTGISIVTMTGMVFIIVGVYGIALSLDLKKVKNMPDKISSELKTKLENLKNEIHAAIKK